MYVELIYSEYYHWK